MLHVTRVLSGHHNAGNPNRLAGFVNDGHLPFCVRAQPPDLICLANASELAPKPMSKHDWSRHQLARLIARVSEHQSLIASTLLGSFFAFGCARIHASCDV